jgi:hypothetical protein
MNWRRGLLRLWVVLAVSWTALVFGRGYFAISTATSQYDLAVQRYDLAVQGLPDYCKGKSSDKLPTSIPAECVLPYEDAVGERPSLPTLFWPYVVLAVAPPIVCAYRVVQHRRSGNLKPAMSQLKTNAPDRMAVGKGNLLDPSSISIGRQARIDKEHHRHKAARRPFGDARHLGGKKCFPDIIGRSLQYSSRSTSCVRISRQYAGRYAAMHFVCFWHKADIPVALTNVRFWG